MSFIICNFVYIKISQKHSMISFLFIVLYLCTFLAHVPSQPLTLNRFSQKWPFLREPAIFRIENPCHLIPYPQKPLGGTYFHGRHPCRKTKMSIIFLKKIDLARSSCGLCNEVQANLGHCKDPAKRGHSGEVLAWTPSDDTAKCRLMDPTRSIF